jgi:hypothetical protein
LRPLRNQRRRNLQAHLHRGAQLFCRAHSDRIKTKKEREKKKKSQ